MCDVLGNGQASRQETAVLNPYNIARTQCARIPARELVRDSFFHYRLIMRRSIEVLGIGQASRNEITCRHTYA